MSAKIPEDHFNVSDGVKVTGDTKPSSIVSGKINDTGEQEDNQFGYTSRLRSHKTQHRTKNSFWRPLNMAGTVHDLGARTDPILTRRK